MTLDYVYTCDRCGKEFRPGTVLADQLRIESPDGLEVLKLDLCPTCRDELVEQLTPEKEPEEVPA